MVEALITLLLALGLTFSKTDSGKIVIDSHSMQILQQDEKFRSEIPSDAVFDIIVTDDDDPIAVN